MVVTIDVDNHKDADAPPPPPSQNSANIDDEDEDDDHQRNQETMKLRDKEKSVAAAESSEEEETIQEDPIPIGDVIRVSGEGKGSRKHYHSFRYDGNQYHLEEPVLLVPEELNQKPKVALIKDIIETANGSMIISGQRFYRPEEAQMRNGRFEQSQSTRELFYSFHRDEFPAEFVMHKSVAHFIPLNQQIPPRMQHPGFIVQRVYNTKKRRLFELADKYFGDKKRKEIDLLIQKTKSRLGEDTDAGRKD